MFRLKISYWPEHECYRITSGKKVVKLASVSNACRIANDYKGNITEIEYQLYKCCKMAIRDRLFYKYGKAWNSMEDSRAIQKSIISAIKRMRTV